MEETVPSSDDKQKQPKDRAEKRTGEGSMEQVEETSARVESAAGQSRERISLDINPSSRHVEALSRATLQSDLPLRACNGIDWGEILAAIESVEDVHQFWRGFRGMGALCILLLLLESVFMILISGTRG